MSCCNSLVLTACLSVYLGNVSLVFILPQSAHRFRHNKLNRTVLQSRKARRFKLFTFWLERFGLIGGLEIMALSERCRPKEWTFLESPLAVGALSIQCEALACLKCSQLDALEDWRTEAVSGD